MSKYKYCLNNGYINTDGSMAVNTKIGRYKVGPNGAWVR